MIIDIHTHNFTGRTEAVVTAAKQHGIDRIVFLGDVFRFGLYPAPEEIRKINDATLADVRRHPDFCRGFVFLNPGNPPDALREELKRCFRHFEFIGVKFEASLNCRSPKLAPVMEFLAETGRPLLQHTWYKTVGRLPCESDPSDVAVLARRYPEVKIVMAHLCGCGHRGVEDIADLPNVVIDTSGAQPEAGLVEYAVRQLGAERVVYGSDASCRDFGCQLAKIRDAAISAADRERILWKNAKELLSW